MSIMNRPGAVPQPLRGMPTGFGGQQQPQQPGRTVSSRLPNGKIANNGSGWAFGGGIPMSGAGLQNSSRQLGGNLSFAQSLSGSQPATPLDPSEFPSLSGNLQASSASRDLWSSAPGRNMAPIHRNQPTPSAQHAQQDDFFQSSARLGGSNQGSFRFGQGNPPSQNVSSDEFPPLNARDNFRTRSGDIGQERSSLMQVIGFGAQGSPVSSSLQGSGAGNGLLNALSANNRATEVRSPDASTPGSSRPQDIRSAIGSDEIRRPPGFREDNITAQTPIQDTVTQSSESRNPLGAIGNDAPTSKPKDDKETQSPAVHDPLAGMALIDKWGLKGLRTLMANYPDYSSAVTGFDPASFGLNLAASEPISTQIYSIVNDTPPRPAVPNFRLPECYNVTNVQPLEAKIQSFNEETLMWMFYSSPQDVKQHLAAAELNNRNWRWHKKHQIWLTKDEIMNPRALSAHHEEGYYIVWDTVNWRKDRRSLILYYADLENLNAPAS